MEGFTISSMQGAVWINPCNYLVAMESLVHEQSHVKLRYIEDTVPILHPHQTSSRFGVGWRTDARPIVGIFEGVYVHIHCAIAFNRCLEAQLIAPALRDEAYARKVALVDQARDGLELLVKHSRFTEMGQSFPHWAKQALSH